MKDSKGHGSDARGGTLAAQHLYNSTHGRVSHNIASDWRAAHQKGIMGLQTVQDIMRFARDTSGNALSHEALLFGHLAPHVLMMGGGG